MTGDGSMYTSLVALATLVPFQGVVRGELLGTESTSELSSPADQSQSTVRLYLAYMAPGSQRNAAPALGDGSDVRLSGIQEILETWIHVLRDHGRRAQWMTRCHPGPATSIRLRSYEF